MGHDLVGAGGRGSRTEPEPKQEQVKRNLKTWGQHSLRWANRVGVGACREEEEKEGAVALRRAGVGVGRMGADGGGGARGWRTGGRLGGGQRRARDGGWHAGGGEARGNESVLGSWQGQCWGAATERPAS